MSKVRVKLVNVSKSFEDIIALRNINLEVARGEYVAVLGPTGAGKTTLLRIIAGIISPDSGEIYMDGNLVNDIPPEDRNVSYLPQTYALFPHMTVLENVMYGLLTRGFSKEEAKSRALETLEMVGLERRAYSFPNELSGGMQQRVALARAIAPPTDLLLLDEPLSALDAILRLELKFQLRKIAKKLKLTVIHVTHDQEVALSIPDRIVVMKKGEILQVGDPKMVYELPNSIYVANFIGEMNFLMGIIIERKNEYAILDTGGWIVKGRIMGEITGREAIAAIRPENIIIHDKHERRKENILEGEVVIKSFSGGIFRYEIELKGGERIILKEVYGFQHDIEEGSRINIYLDPKRTLIYPYPPEGLELALRVE